MSETEKEKRHHIRDWVYIALFGALWGAVEISLGSLLHTIFPPLTNTILTGIILSGIAAIIVLSGASFISKQYSIVLIGIIAALLKLFSFGGVKLGPVLAIILQAVLMQLVWLIPSRKTSSGPDHLPEKSTVLFAFAALPAVSWNFFHRFMMLGILYGKKMVETAVMMAKNGSGLLGIDETKIVPILLVLLLIRMVAGIAAGIAASLLSRGLKRRFRDA